MAPGVPPRPHHTHTCRGLGQVAGAQPGRNRPPGRRPRCARTRASLQGGAFAPGRGVGRLLAVSEHLQELWCVFGDVQHRRKALQPWGRARLDHPWDRVPAPTPAALQTSEAGPHRWGVSGKAGAASQGCGRGGLGSLPVLAAGSAVSGIHAAVMSCGHGALALQSSPRCPSTPHSTRPRQRRHPFTSGQAGGFRQSCPETQGGRQ